MILGFPQWVAPAIAAGSSLLGIPIAFWLAVRRERDNWLRAERLRVAARLLAVVDHFVVTLRPAANSIAAARSGHDAAQAMISSVLQTGDDHAVAELAKLGQTPGPLKRDVRPVVPDWPQTMAEWRAAEAEAQLLLRAKTLRVLEDEVYEAIKSALVLLDSAARAAVPDLDKRVTDISTRVARARTELNHELRRELGVDKSGRRGALRGPGV